MIYQAVHAGFAYFQREAGYTRTGSHDKRVNGRETGQWHEADLVVAHWLQHTSRDGDMQLHVHSQIAHVARTGTDGKWRAPDSLGYNEHVGAVGGDHRPAPGGSPHRPVRPGVDRARRRPRLRDQGHLGGDDARVLLAPGVDHRRPARPRRAVRAALRPRAVPARARAARRSRRTSPRARARKARWTSRSRTRTGRTSSRARSASRSRRSPRRSGTRPARTRPARVPPELALQRAAQQAVALAQQEKSTWTRADLVKYLGRVLPRPGRDPAAGGRAAGGHGRPDAALGVRAGPVPGGPRACRGPARPAARRRPQRLPPPRRRPLRHPRPAEHGRRPGRAGRSRRRAAPDPRRRRAGARRRSRTTCSVRWKATHDGTRRGSAPDPGCARTRPPPRCRC